MTFDAAVFILDPTSRILRDFFSVVSKLSLASNSNGCHLLFLPGCGWEELATPGHTALPSRHDLLPWCSSAELTASAVTIGCDPIRQAWCHPKNPCKRRNTLHPSRFGQYLSDLWGHTHLVCSNRTAWQPVAVTVHNLLMRRMLH